MRRLLLAVGLVAVSAGCAPCEPRPNLGLYKQQLVGWHDSGDYEKCFAQAARRGEAALDRAIAGKQPRQQMAVVFDIDETLLSNWAYLTTKGFDVKLDTFFAWVKTHDDPALAPTKAIYEKARAAGIPIYLITGRVESVRADTVRQLRAAGITGWSGLFLKPDTYSQPSIVPFKSGIRRKLEESGHVIVLNMGDQFSDLEGGYARTAVKLPNPYYYIR
jgi:predicted secreted acid phosphatase